jgi:hypothetical protein
MYKGETVAYEWVIEPTDDNGDILESLHADTYREAIQVAAQCDYPDQHRVDIGLVRDQGSDSEGIEDRQWAYMTEDGKLPECFDGGSKVPQRFHAELRNA